MGNANEIERRWIRAQKRISKSLAARDFAGALRILDSFLLTQVSTDLYSEAHGLRAIVLEKCGETEPARASLLEAHSSSPPLSYARYTLELALGEIAERHGELPDAIGWYRRALDTAAGGEEISGATAVLSFLRLRTDPSPVERTQCSLVCERSWQVLGLSSEPDLKDLIGTAKKLIRRSGQQSRDGSCP